MYWNKSLNDVAEEYFNFLSRNENTSEYSIRSVYSNHIASLLGCKRIKSIKRKDIMVLQSYMIEKKHFGKKYSNKTINNITNVFNIILNYAVHNEYIKDNPCQNFPKLRVIKDYDLVEFWTDDQFKKAIIYEEDFVWYSFLTILYLTGMRKGEIRGLRWKDLDFEQNLIHIRRHINDKRIHKEGDTDKEWVITGRKNGDELTLLMDRNSRKLLLQLFFESKRCYNWNENDYVYGGKRPIGQNTPKRHLDRIAKKADLPCIKVHGLRHSHVSFLISKGLDAYKIAQRIGDTVDMVLKVYGHLFPNPQAAIVQELDKSFDFEFDSKI